MFNRTAYRPAIVAVLEGTLRRARQSFEEIPRVQLVVAKELIGRSVDIVGAGLDDCVHDCSGVAPVLSGSLSLQAELSQCIHWKQHGLSPHYPALIERRLVTIGVIIVDTVDQEDVRLFPL